MSDAEVSATTEGTPAVVDTPQEGESGMVLVKVGGLEFNEALIMGDITVTREPTEVPEDQLQALQLAANEAGIQLEVVPE